MLSGEMQNVSKSRLDNLWLTDSVMMTIKDKHTLYRKFKRNEIKLSLRKPACKSRAPEHWKSVNSLKKYSKNYQNIAKFKVITES